MRRIWYFLIPSLIGVLETAATMNTEAWDGSESQNDQKYLGNEYWYELLFNGNNQLIYNAHPKKYQEL